MKFKKRNQLVHIVLLQFSYTVAMEIEAVATQKETPDPDIEMGIMQEPVQPQEHATSPNLLIEEPRAVYACCISKHALLLALQGACITGAVFTKNIPVVPIFIGLVEAFFLGAQIHQTYNDCTSGLINKSIHATFSDNLHKQGTLESLAIDNRPIPFGVIDSVEYALIKHNEHMINYIIHDDTITPIILKFTKQDQKKRKQKIITLLLCLKKNTIRLPRDLGYTLLSHVPELICNKQVFSKVLNYASPSNFHKICTNCPLSWFNYQYHTMHNTESKEGFAHTTATAMAQAEVAYKQALFASSNQGVYELPNKDALTAEYYDRYHAKIITSYANNVSVR